ncbi:carboxyl transferase domain-containing protein [Micromonospora sp. NPDC005220]|uniref:carboxyl transferase domain-containing protein n=1 Tax=Micromonospora sp. NPDC005220 TaxID=3155589 RepID=UPI0033B0C8E6
MVRISMTPSARTPWRRTRAPYLQPFGGSAMTVTIDAGSAAGARPDPLEPIGLLARLFDACSLRPLMPLDGEVVAARGLVEGMPVVAFAYAQQATGGVLGTGGCARLVAAIEAAVAEKLPIVGIWHPTNLRSGATAATDDSVGQVFAARARAVGKTPSISVVLGPSNLDTVPGSALGDVVITTGVGPLADDGSRVEHVVAPNESAALRRARVLVSLLGTAGRPTPVGQLFRQVGHHAVRERRSPVPRRRGGDDPPS